MAKWFVCTEHKSHMKTCVEQCVNNCKGKGYKKCDTLQEYSNWHEIKKVEKLIKERKKNGS